MCCIYLYEHGEGYGAGQGHERGVERGNMISISRGMSCNQNSLSKELGKGFEKMVTIT